MSTQLAYEKYFPFETIRDEQRRVIEFAIDAYVKQGKKYVIAEMGTGCGKSATGLTIARYLCAEQKQLFDFDKELEDGSYILTTQKVLQEQYVNDFGSNTKNLLRSIKSSSNFSCLHHKDQSCGESRRLLHTMRKQLIGTEFWNCCQSQCPYKIAKQEFVDSATGVTSFSYFLAETGYAKSIKPRQMLIIDECHNIETQVSSFIEVTFSEKFAKTILGCRLPTLNGDDEAQMVQVLNWIKKTYKPKLQKHIEGLEKAIENGINQNTQLGSITKQYEMLDKHICKVNRFISSFDPQNWIMNVVEPFNKKSGKKFEFKPIDVSPFTHDMLYRFGGVVLMMSATVVDKEIFCKSIGLDPNDVAYIRIPSPFPVQNKPIHYLPVGKMSYENISVTLPKLVEITQMLLDKHANDKGIIHCVNYKIAQFLHDNIKTTRFIIHNSENRDEMLKKHLTSPDPTVLLSPSMMEGVDLADDSSRFQILCKVPFPYLGDKMVKKKKDRDKNWYQFQTVKSIIQSMGRSIRNENDHADSYILDEDWTFFYSRNKRLFPEDFVNALV